jgi:hypothetical protein
MRGRGSKERKLIFLCAGALLPVEALHDRRYFRRLRLRLAAEISFALA